MPTEESLVHEVIEDSSESDTATDQPTSPCKVKTVRRVGLFLLLGFVLPGAVLPFVGLSVYLSAKSANPDKEFPFPTLDAVALQVPFVIFAAIAAFSGLTYRLECCRQKWIRFELFGVPVWFCVCLFLFTFNYVTYTACFFRTSEFLEVDPVWSLDEYEDFVEVMHEGQPQVVLEGATDDCGTSPIVINGVSSTDASDFPNVSAVLDLVGVVVVRTEVRVHWDGDSIDLLKESAEVIKRCRGDQLELVNVTQTDTVVGWKERALITKDGELPRSVNRGSGIAAGVFASGLYHVFKVDAIPVMRATIIKDNGQIDMSVTSCMDLDWICA
jgi:hypothetical protein